METETPFYGLVPQINIALAFMSLLTNNLPLIWILFTGAENYENQMKYGKEVFQELKELQANGLMFDRIHHEIKIISCCD